MDGLTAAFLLLTAQSFGLRQLPGLMDPAGMDLSYSSTSVEDHEEPSGACICSGTAEAPDL